MDTDRLTAFRAELEEILRLRESLMCERDKTDDNQEQDRLGFLIRDINENRLPKSRDRLRAAFNAAKGNKKHQLSELIGEVDGALSGIGTFRDLDVSEATLNSLKRQHGLAKSNREGRQIAMKIREIESARVQLAKQPQAIAQEEMRRQETESEIQRLDEILYGHLQKKD